MPKPTHKTSLIPTSGFDDERTPTAAPAPEAPMPVSPQVALHPPDAIPAPTVSFAPPMDVDTAPVSIAPTPLIPAAEAFEITQMMEAMRAEMARMHASQAALIAENERLAAVAQNALTRPAANVAAFEAPKAQPEYKLYFSGQRLEKPDDGRPPFMTLDLRGGVHTCARFEMPIVFGASRDDQYPHAFLTREKGDWLIANDCPRDAYGNPAEIRYKWSPEALAAFAQADREARAASLQAV